MSQLDLRGLPLRERHRPVFSAFDGLQLGEALELCDDRDLDAVQRLMQAARNGCYAWEPIESQTGEWRARIGKVAQSRGCEGCACACGGVGPGAVCQ